MFTAARPQAMVEDWLPPASMTWAVLDHSDSQCLVNANSNEVHVATDVHGPLFQKESHPMDAQSSKSVQKHLSDSHARTPKSLESVQQNYSDNHAMNTESPGSVSMLKKTLIHQY